MRLEDRSNHLELGIVGYQFGNATGDPFDDSWLVVQGDVRAGEARWEFRDPCLLVAEAREIGRWLRVANPDAPAGRLWFTEPCLAFDVAERGEAQVTLRVELGYEAGPPGSEPSTDAPFRLDLRLPADALRAAGDAWLAEVSRFPERSGPDGP